VSRGNEARRCSSIGLEHPPVIHRVADEQDEPFESGVTHLERGAAFERLQVAQSRLCLDRRVVGGETEDGVPRPTVAWN
jgi:hypothetical protein